MIPVLILSCKKRFFSGINKSSESPPVTSNSTPATSNSTPAIYNENFFDAMTLVELRDLAVDRKICLESKTHKSDVVEVFTRKFLSRPFLVELESLAPLDFNIISDESGNFINLSLAFRRAGKNLQRYIYTVKFQELAAACAQRMETTLDKIMFEQDGDTYVCPILAVDAATTLNIDFKINLLTHFLYDLPAKQQEIADRTIMNLEKDLSEDEIRARFRIPQWGDFKMRFAYYSFAIENTVKCGAVGLANEAKTANLDKRLSTHRSTYARLRLINVIEFFEQESVTTFENVMKAHLMEYSIGANIPLEQYECRGENTAEIIKAKVLEVFEGLPEGLGRLCSSDTIAKYNAVYSDAVVVDESSDSTLVTSDSTLVTSDSTLVTSDSTPVIYNEEYFNPMKVIHLRAIAKKFGIRLRGVTAKTAIIAILVENLSNRPFLIELESSEPLDFNVFFDESGKFINISMVFRQLGKKIQRYLSSVGFQELASACAQRMGTTVENLMFERGGDIYLCHILAVDAAATLNVDFNLKIITHFLYDLPAKQMEKANFKITDLEKKLTEKTLRDKLRTPRKGDLRIRFAYYYFAVGNVVKCGIVGLNNEANTNYLDSRLDSHRSTFPELKLINAIAFFTRKSATTFKNLVKLHLKEYSIGAAVPLEEYECRGENTAEIVDAIVLRELKGFPESFGYLCSPDLIKAYNAAHTDADIINKSGV